MSAQVEDRHREAAMTALNSATPERHGKWHPEVTTVAQLLADTEAAAREEGASAYSDSMDAERAGWVARIAELERERDEARACIHTALGWVTSAMASEGSRGMYRKLEGIRGALNGVAAQYEHDGHRMARKFRLERDALRSEVERLSPWARFGARAFEDFWQDGEPGDLEGGDLQEMARDCGLLGRTAEVDAGATHADGCDWQPGMHVDDCDCWAPLLAPYTQEDSNAT